MNPAGIVLMIAGAWITCQVFGGNALGRLNIVPADSSSTGGGGSLSQVPGQLAGGIPGGPNNPTNWWDLIPFPGTASAQAR